MPQYLKHTNYKTYFYLIHDDARLRKYKGMLFVKDSSGIFIEDLKENLTIATDEEIVLAKLSDEIIDTYYMARRYWGDKYFLVMDQNSPYYNCIISVPKKDAKNVFGIIVINVRNDYNEMIGQCDFYKSKLKRITNEEYLYQTIVKKTKHYSSSQIDLNDV